MEKKLPEYSEDEIQKLFYELLEILRRYHPKVAFSAAAIALRAMLEMITDENFKDEIMVKILKTLVYTGPSNAKDGDET
jgi:hypothetical protein